MGWIPLPKATFNYPGMGDDLKSKSIYIQTSDDLSSLESYQPN